MKKPDMNNNRRKFIRTATIAATGLQLVSLKAVSQAFLKEIPFKISLAEWSLHKALNNKEMTNLDFPVRAARDFGIYGLEYVSTFFKDTSTAYLSELLQITKDHQAQNVIIMVDGEGNLGDSNAAARIKSVEQHHRWVEAARFLGCHSIRVNARGEGTESQVADAAVEGLARLAEFATTVDINVIVENHGGYSSNGKWITGVISRVNMKNCGTLPDFGNFNISSTESYDRYQGVKEMMAYAKGVSAKSNVFDEAGNEAAMDYYRLMQIVFESGYRGWIGVEYEGTTLSEAEGILATKKLLERIFEQWS